MKETKKPWIWKFPLLHHDGSPAAVKAKKDTEREGGVKIKPWSITPKSEETTLPVTIQPVQCLQEVPAAHH